MKTCTCCGNEKPRSEFYSRAASKDGLQPVCKSCDARKRQDRYFGNHEAEKAKRREYQKTELGKLLHGAAVAAWRKRSPDRRAAHIALDNAIRAGRVVRQPCFVCGEKAEAHHPNYDAPLDVIWLCDEHHKQAHMTARQSGRGMSAYVI